VVVVEAEVEELFEDEEGESGDDKAKTRDVTLAEKQDPNFLPTPRYWVSEADVLLKAVPLDKKEKKELEAMDPERVVPILRPRAPKWLIAFRNIARSTDERSGIFSVLPLVGAGNSAPILNSEMGARHDLLFEAVLTSIVTDFMVRCKVGGTNFNAFYMEQIGVISPDQVSTDVADHIVPNVLELVFTSEHFRPLAEACGYEFWGAVTWTLCMVGMFVYFFAASGEPVMAAGMGLFVVWVVFITWWIYGRDPLRRRPMQQIILSQPNQPTVIGNVQASWTKKISPWLAAILLVGIGLYLGTAWLMGSRSPYRSPEDVRRLDGAMRQNSVSTADPAQAYQQSIEKQQVSPPPQKPKSWSDTDDLTDWSRFVKP
jgi:hypothetical protein